MAKEEKVNKFSWSQTEKRKEVAFNMTEDFVYANNVWMTYGNEIKRFRKFFYMTLKKKLFNNKFSEVPNKYFSNACNVREDVVNFKNVKTICAQMDISEGNEYLHFRNYFENITMVSNPNFLNISRYKNLQVRRNRFRTSGLQYHSCVVFLGVPQEYLCVRRAKNMRRKFRQLPKRFEE